MIRRRAGPSYSDLEIHRLLGKGAHFVVETESVFARLFRREDRVQLSFFGILHDQFVPRVVHTVVDVKGAAGLDLDLHQSREIGESKGVAWAYGEVERHLRSRVVHVGEETGLLVRHQFVC